MKWFNDVAFLTLLHQEYMRGATYSEVAKKHGVSVHSLSAHFKRHGLGKRHRGIQRPKHPKNGDICGSKAIGKAKRGNYRYTACIVCGEPRWVRLDAYKQRGNGYCLKCKYLVIAAKNKGTKRSAEVRRILSAQKMGKKNPQWKGGKFFNTSGYIMCSLPATHRFFSMSDASGRVQEHRLIMAEKLGRPLRNEEVVHHLNGIKDDNRLGNLHLVRSHSEHMVIHNRIGVQLELPKMF